MRTIVRRKWLNPPNSYNTGYIKYGVYPDNNEMIYSDIGLKLADCSRIIEFEFSFGTKKERKISMKKLAIFRESLEELEVWAQELCEEVERSEQAEKSD